MLLTRLSRPSRLMLLSRLSRLTRPSRLKGGAVIVDKPNAELYLKCINQIMTLYKVRLRATDAAGATNATAQADLTGMIFTEEERGMMQSAVASQKELVSAL